MTAFLFIPATQDARHARRVDFSNIAALFAETEEPARRHSLLQGRAMRLATVAMILVGIVGDTVLVARPKLLADVFATAYRATTDQATTQGVARGA